MSERAKGAREPKTLLVTGCARCGMTHPITFRPFVGEPIVDNDGTVWDWWGTCANTGDPVLLMYDDDEKDGT